MTDFLSFARALVVAPHTDDEMACAGTVRRLVRAGTQVRYVAVSRCEESVPAGFARDVLEQECRACLSSLGVARADVEVWGFQVRHFPARRQDILERLVALNRQFAPQLVLLPSQLDRHQDHATVAAEGFRAFKHSSVLGYELLQNLPESRTGAFVELSTEDFEAKMAAIAHYRSQSNRTYATREVIEGLARVRGMQCGAQLAEAFEVVRLISRLPLASRL